MSTLSYPAPDVAASKHPRLISLDVLRGLTIFAMIFANNKGDSDHFYAPFEHAEWNGWTPTDLIFPTFLFMVGVAMTFSFESRLAKGASKIRLFEQAIRRSLILFLLGEIMYGFGAWRLIAPFVLVVIGLVLVFWDEPPLGLGHNVSERIRKLFGWLALIGGIVFFALDFRYFQSPHPPVLSYPLRVPGVLQRIAVCYLIASTLVLLFRTGGRVVCAGVLLIGYWWLVHYVHPPQSFVDHLPPERFLGRLQEWIDVKLLGAHLYGERPDPEGILSTMPAIVTCLIGVLVGEWLHSYRERRDHVIGLFVAASLLMFVGLWWNHEFPINKKIWTSSYVLLAAGIATQLLAICYWFVDIRGYQKWAWPFLVVGTNAIAVYFAAGVGARILMRMAKVHEGNRTVSLWNYLYHDLVHAAHRISPAIPPEFLSALFSFLYVFLFFLLLIPLYRRRIFIRV